MIETVTAKAALKPKTPLAVKTRDERVETGRGHAGLKHKAVKIMQPTIPVPYLQRGDTWFETD